MLVTAPLRTAPTEILASASACCALRSLSTSWRLPSLTSACTCAGGGRAGGGGSGEATAHGHVHGQVPRACDACGVSVAVALHGRETLHASSCR